LRALRTAGAWRARGSNGSRITLRTDFPGFALRSRRSLLTLRTGRSLFALGSLRSFRSGQRLADRRLIGHLILKVVHLILQLMDPLLEYVVEQSGEQ